MKICTITIPSIERLIRMGVSLAHNKKKSSHGNITISSTSKEYAMFCAEEIKLRPGFSGYLKVRHRVFVDDDDVVPILSSLLYDSGVYARNDKYIRGYGHNKIYIHNASKNVVRIKQDTNVGKILVRQVPGCI